MKNKHLLVGRELGRKKWTLKIGAINVAIFGKYAADFGFLALVTLTITIEFSVEFEKKVILSYLAQQSCHFSQRRYKRGQKS